MPAYLKYFAALAISLSATATIAGEEETSLRIHPFWQFDLEENLSADISLADVDGDGDLDVLTANGRHWAEQDFVYLNNGEGRMLEANYLGAFKSASYTIQAGDLDGNGSIDAVVVRDKLEALVFLNDGSGKYSLSGKIAGSGDNARSAVLFDVDGDSNLDLVVATRRGEDMIYRGNGSGGFHSGTALPDEGFGSTGLAIGDLDDDGDTDLIIARRDDSESVIMLNQGGSFRAVALPGSKGDHRKVVIAELTGDKYPDIVLADTDGTLLIYRGTHGGDYRSSTKFGIEGDNIQALTSIDLDGDGDIDLIAGCDGKNLLFHNNGNGTFVRQEIGEEADSYGVAAGDMNGDGLPDIVVANSGSANQVIINLSGKETQK